MEVLAAKHARVAPDARLQNLSSPAYEALRRRFRDVNFLVRLGLVIGQVSLMVHAL